MVLKHPEGTQQVFVLPVLDMAIQLRALMSVSSSGILHSPQWGAILLIYSKIPDITGTSILFVSGLKIRMALFWESHHVRGTPIFAISTKNAFFLRLNAVFSVGLRRPSLWGIDIASASLFSIIHRDALFSRAPTSYAVLLQRPAGGH